VRLGESESRYMSYFLEVDSKGNKKTIGPTSWEDWENARTLVKFLKIFYMVTLRFSDSLHVTSNFFFNELICMHTNLLQLCKNKYNLLSGMTMNMMLKFEKYWGCEVNQKNLLYVANVLDPRLKLKYVKFVFVSLYEFYLKADKVMDDNRYK